ncbi:hypothetical protein HNQ59_003775 [Chitinivorax tropicus]|uniref:Flagellar hook-length control protein-like C-terminal domain-containing protein n=1 Tax=Chitinivorax tropicus TaxID=714531 RepID=A0A840MVV7_9PROT|nr:flagellar hook-length control protein FliK [Chitinivorax tropicus]MBB5020456.1 hypothetical protein [Chitinivorax tropicus]
MAEITLTVLMPASMPAELPSTVPDGAGVGAGFGAALQMALGQLALPLDLKALPMEQPVDAKEQGQEKKVGDDVAELMNPLLTALFAQIQAPVESKPDLVEAASVEVGAPNVGGEGLADALTSSLVDSLAVEDSAVQRKNLPGDAGQQEHFEDMMNQAQAMQGAQLVNRAESAQMRQPHAMQIAAPVSEPVSWGKELGQNLIWLSGQQNQIAEMQLNPPHLGPLEVRVTVQNDQASLVFASPHASVREVIESALPRLSAMFAESGLAMGSVQVGGQSLADQRQQSQGHGRRGASKQDEVEVEPLWRAATQPWGISIRA